MRDIIAHEVETMGLDEKRRLVDELRAAIAEDLAGGSGEPGECPRCGCASFVRKGRGRRGEQRWLCRGCGRTFSAGTRSVLARSRLDAGTWARFASCAVARLSLRDTAAELGVCLSTAWFMRMRACEVMRSRLAGMRGGHAVQVDGTYLSESLSGDRSLPGAEPMPRPPRHHGGGVRLRGLSGEKVCVVCGANDLGDCFCEVASRGRCSSRGLADAPRCVCASPDSANVHENLSAFVTNVLRLRALARRRTYLPDFPSMREFSSRWLGPPNSTSLPWCTTRSTMAAASLSSANTVPHLLNSTLVVNTTLLLS